MTLEMMRNAVTDVFSNEVESYFVGADPLTEFNRLREINEWVRSQKWPQPYV